MIHNWENYFDISSEYWKKVEKIYEKNESFPKKVVKERNLHHKFPRSFSKKDGVDVDNEDDNLVSLSLADHFRVHYYLWKCSKKGYRGMMAKAFVFMRKKMVAYASDETIEQMAKDYEAVMKEAAEVTSKALKGKKLSEEHKKKLSKAKKGKYTGEKHSMYGKHHSEESKKKMSEAHKGEKNHNYGKKMSKEQKKKISEAEKGKKLSEETKKKLSEAHKGYKHSEDAKKKISEMRKGKTPNKGMHWFTNGKENKLCYECPEGFTPGRVK